MVFVAQTLESVGIGAQTPGVGERVVGVHNRVDAVYVAPSSGVAGCGLPSTATP